MAKLLEKALTGAIKERKHTLGTKQVVSSMKNSKLVVISQSVSIFLHLSSPYSSFISTIHFFNSSGGDP